MAVLTNSQVIYTPTLNYVGSDSFTYTIIDENGLTATATVYLTIGNENDAPVFVSAPSLIAPQGIAYTYTIKTTDVEGDRLTISAPTLPSWLTFVDKGNGLAELTGIPTLAEVGSHGVLLEVSDGLTVTKQVFTITISNTAPRFTTIPSTLASQYIPYTYSIATTDADSNILIISAPTLPSWLTFLDNGNGTAVLSGTPTLTETGNHAVLLQVTDGLTVTAQAFTITILNHAPLFTTIPLTSAKQYMTYTYAITATDADSNTLIITAPTLPSWLTFLDNGNGIAVLSGTPVVASGRYTVALQVTDGLTFTSQVFSIAVSNVAPQFASAPATSANQNVTYSYTVAATDYNGDMLSFTALTLPSWLTFVDNGDNTAMLSGTPTITNVGNHAVVLQVTDGLTLTEQAFTITISNSAPLFTSAPIISASQYITYSYAITATDADSGTLTITAPTLPTWLTLTNNSNGTAVLSGTPTVTNTGNHAVVLQVTDGLSLTQQVFTITINNSAPLFTSTPITSTYQNITYTYAITTTDADSNTLTITVPTLPSWLTLTNNSNGTAILTGTPTLTNGGTAGLHTVLLQVTDGLSVTPQSFTIKVLPPNLVVDIIADVDNANPAPGDNSLREAIAYANAGNTITFAPALSGQTITLASELLINKAMTINGTVPLTLSGNNAVRVFNVITGATSVTFDSLTIANGSAVDGAGMYIASAGSTVTLNNSTLANNNVSNDGGAVWNSGLLTVNNSTINGNSSSSSRGGGLYNLSGTLTINRCSIYSNSSMVSGGGAYNSGGTLTVNNSTMAYNVSGDGVTATMGGSGLRNTAGSTLVVNSSTIVNNSYDGIWNSGTLSLQNNILANNTTGNDCYDTGGTFATNTNNLIKDGSCWGATNIITGTDPQLNPLANNGGSTLTMMPFVCSPAINAGGATTLTTDQTGNPRVANGTPDIGAVEVQTAPSSPLTVQNTSDAVMIPGTLREAICAVSAGGTVNFNPTLTGTTITLASELLINKAMTISGTVPITISGNNAVRVFNVITGATSVTFEGLTIANGVGYDGAGIYIGSASSTVTVNNSTLTNNNSSHDGAGLLSVGGTVIVNSSTITHNTAVNGCGLYNSGGTMTVNNSTIAYNSCTASMGGLSNGGGTMTVNNSTINNNSSVGGGSGLMNDGTLTVNNSTIANNSSSDWGGGLFNNAGRTATFNNSTIAGNSATSGGGGIRNIGTLNLQNTIIANSTSGDCSNGGTLGTNTNNLIKDGTCGPTLTGDPLLNPLANNGGTTLTMLPSACSAVINAGGATTLTTDQTGNPRVGTPDIGAVEVQTAPSSPLTVQNTSDAVMIPGTLREAICAVSAGGTVNFNPTLTGTTITLASELLINKAMTISGTVPITISGNNMVRVFNVTAGPVTFDSLTIANGNTAGNGGGIYVNPAVVVTVQDSIFTNNHATNGGAILNEGGTLTVRRTTFMTNSVTNSGGSIDTGGTNGSTTLENSTFSGNSAVWGGGIACCGTGGTTTIDNSTFSGNSATSGGGGITNNQTMHVRNSIIANSTSGGDCWNSGGTIATNVGNLIEDGTCSPSVASDPKLGALANNGGTTLTMAPQANSPVLSRGSITDCLTTDQTGLARPQPITDTTCDIGAVESALLPAAPGPFAYIANYGSNNVSVIDTSINAVVATVAVETNPYGIAIKPDGTRVYVTNAGSSNVSVIDTSNNTVVVTPGIGSNPYADAITPDGTRLYVVNYNASNVSVVDTGTNGLVTTVAVGTSPVGVAVTPDGTRVYVANYGITTVSVIDTSNNTVVATVAVGANPYGVAVTPDGRWVYVTNSGGNTVSVIDTSSNTVVGLPIAVGTNPYGVAVTPDGTRVYVANAGGNTVSVIDTSSNSVTATVSGGFNEPRGVAVTPDGARVYVANVGSGTGNTVTVIDTSSNTVAATVAVGTGPFALGQFITPLPLISTAVVDMLTDNGVNACTASANDCSLRGAISRLSSGGTITFDPSLSGGTITLGSALGIYKSMTISGTVPITLDGVNKSRVFYVGAGTVTLDSLTIANGNAGTDAGGGLFNKSTMTVNKCTVISNTAWDGGGLYSNGTLTVNNSTIAYNSANSGGGGIMVSGSATIKNSTIANNSALWGNIYIYAGSTFHMMNTIIANSTVNCYNFGTIATNVNNLIEDGTCNSGTTLSGYISGDPKLGALANNGGNTLTLALLANSPALSAGDNGTCLPTDQIGNSRPLPVGQPTCDIGALESSLLIQPLAFALGSVSGEMGRSVKVDSSGNIYLLGTFDDNGLDFDPGVGVVNLTSAGAEDVFLAKYDSSGALLWAKNMGGPSSDTGNSLSLDSSGNPYVTGYFYDTAIFSTTTLTSAGAHDIFLAKYNGSDGTLSWANGMGGTGSDEGNGLSVDGSGNAYITGYFIGTADFSGTPLTSTGLADIFMAKYDSSGALVWAKGIGGTSSDSGNSVSVDSTGTVVYLTGIFNGTVDFDPVGTFNLTSGGTNDIFLAKYDNNGNFGGWAINIVGQGSGPSLGVDSTGKVYLLGSFQGSNVDFDPGVGVVNLNSEGLHDIFLAQYNSSGTLQWANGMGGTGPDFGNSLSLDSSGYAYITGYFQNTANFGVITMTSAGMEDIFLAKYNSSGTGLWAKGMGSGNYDNGNGVSVDSSGHPYITGFFNGTVDFDPSATTFNLVSVSGTNDIFMVRYDSTAGTPRDKPGLDLLPPSPSRVYLPVIMKR